MTTPPFQDTGTDTGRGLVLDSVSIRLGGRILIDLSTEIGPGEVVTVMGPSGSGKSTLLAYIGGFLDPAFSAEGRIFLKGRDITTLAAHQRRVGVLFQDDLLFSHMSVCENLAFAIHERARGRSARAARAEAALAEIGLAGYGARDPATLSGGQRARVALMRVLLAEPQALLLDEPFSKLDAERRTQIRGLVFAKARERGLPVLLVTHDPDDAEAAGGSVVRL